jgi:dTDP-4-amino-4,6-dideoxygalactose transaminase
LGAVVRKAAHGRFAVPYDRYAAENAPLLEDVVKGLIRVLSIQDADEAEIYLREFECEYASSVGAAAAVGTGSGTGALALALAALGVGPGDEVVTTPHTYIATALAVSDTGARPVFADIGADLNLDPAQAEAKVTSRTKALLPVHIYGRPCAMRSLLALAAGRGLPVVEDACQAQGTRVEGKAAGSLGAAGCFSFHPTKLVGGLGDGGILVTGDRALAERVRGLREAVRDDPAVLRSRRTPCCLDPVHVPFLRAKLRRLPETIARRMLIARAYDETLRGRAGVRLLPPLEGGAHSFRNYTFLCEDRDAVMARLHASGVEARRFYAVPLHLRREFAALGHVPGDFPACEAAYAAMLSLPVSQALSDAEVEHVCAALKKALP